MCDQFFCQEADEIVSLLWSFYVGSILHWYQYSLVDSIINFVILNISGQRTFPTLFCLYPLQSMSDLHSSESMLERFTSRFKKLLGYFEVCLCHCAESIPSAITSILSINPTDPGLVVTMHIHALMLTPPCLTNE